MANTIEVTGEVDVSAPGLIDRTFEAGDQVAPWSPYYWALLWSGHAVDTGVEFTAEGDKVFAPNMVVVSETDPDIAPPGVWIQPLGNGNWTMWFAVED